jgi:hypothetical protein
VAARPKKEGGTMSDPKPPQTSTAIPDNAAADVARCLDLLRLLREAERECVRVRLIVPTVSRERDRYNQLTPECRKEQAEALKAWYAAWNKADEKRDALRVEIQTLALPIMQTAFLAGDENGPAKLRNLMKAWNSDPTPPVYFRDAENFLEDLIIKLDLAKTSPPMLETSPSQPDSEESPRIPLTDSSTPSLFFPLEPFLCARDLATKIGENAGWVEPFLRRYHEAHPECRIEVPNPKPREPRWLYRTTEVWPALLEHLAGRRR